LDNLFCEDIPDVHFYECFLHLCPLHLCLFKRSSLYLLHALSLLDQHVMSYRSRCLFVLNLLGLELVLSVGALHIVILGSLVQPSLFPLQHGFQFLLFPLLSDTLQGQLLFFYEFSFASFFLLMRRYESELNMLFFTFESFFQLLLSSLLLLPQPLLFLLFSLQLLFKLSSLFFF